MALAARGPLLLFRKPPYSPPHRPGIRPEAGGNQTTATPPLSMSMGHICSLRLHNYSHGPVRPPSIPLSPHTHTHNSPCAEKMDGMLPNHRCCSTCESFTFFTTHSTSALFPHFFPVRWLPQTFSSQDNEERGILTTPVGQSICLSIKSSSLGVVRIIFANLNLKLDGLRSRAATRWSRFHFQLETPPENWNHKPGLCCAGCATLWPIGAFKTLKQRLMLSCWVIS